MNNELAANTRALHLDNMTRSTFDDDPKHWVRSDAGPLILLQAHAIRLWKGSHGSSASESVYDDGSIETDCDFVSYDAGEQFAIGITDGDLDPSEIVHRYDRDMLILRGSELSARLFILPTGEVGLVQVQCIVDNFQTLMLKTRAETPLCSRPFTMVDDRLRLMTAAADAGASEVPITPGRKLWNYHELETCSVYFITDAD